MCIYTWTYRYTDFSVYGKLSQTPASSQVLLRYNLLRAQPAEAINTPRLFGFESERGRHDNQRQSVLPLSPDSNGWLGWDGLCKGALQRKEWVHLILGPPRSHNSFRMGAARTAQG